jgi:WD40 repeat protein
VTLRDAHTVRGLETRLGHESDITSLAFSPDGRRLATASLDKTVIIWEVAVPQPGH